MAKAARLAAIVVSIGIVRAPVLAAQTEPDSSATTANRESSVWSTSTRAGISATHDTLTAADSIAFAAAEGEGEAWKCPLSPREVNLRRAGVAAVFVGGNAGLYSYFKRAWWSGEKADHFFFHADWDENFRDQDKFGHMFGGYHLARYGNAFVRSACVSPRRATVISAAYAAAFQLQIEIWDGLYKKYGFSYADLIANTSGTALEVLHETYPATRAVKPTISYYPSAALRNDNLNTELRPTLDYSGQTYWFSTDVNALLPTSAKPFWPSFIRFSVGHSITNWIDPETGANIRAQRKLLLSLDFDAEKLPGNNPLWKTIKRQLSYIRFPAPALQLTPDLRVIGWYR
ncbi:MAG: DUF2279 domain-containing protein [Gemmatimonadaceae bacterium]